MFFLVGRVSSVGFLPNAPRLPGTRDTLSSTSVAIPPEEALFRRHGAPERYEEDDFYWANKNLRETQVLPDSDLLKAVHEYTSKFYGRAGDKGITDFKSMDETALIAIGVLLEEWAGTVVGDGWGVFVEGEEREEENSDEKTAVSENSAESIENENQNEGGEYDSQDNLETNNRMPNKRRKHINRPEHKDNNAITMTSETSPIGRRKRRKLRHTSENSI